MDSPKSNDGTATLLHNSSTRGEGKAAVVVQIAAATNKLAGWKKGIAIFDFILRLVAIAAGLAAASIKKPSLSPPSFSNSTPNTTISRISRSLYVSFPRFLLLILDTVMGVVTTAAASSAASIVYLAHNSNVNANWTAICQQVSLAV